MEKENLYHYPSKESGEKLLFPQAVMAMLNGKNYLAEQGFTIERNFLDGRISFPDGSRVTCDDVLKCYNANDGIPQWLMEHTPSREETERVNSIDKLLIKIVQERGTFKRTQHEYPYFGQDVTRTLIIDMKNGGYNVQLSVKDPSLAGKVDGKFGFVLFRNPKYFVVEYRLSLNQALIETIDSIAFNEIREGIEAAIQLYNKKALLQKIEYSKNKQALES